MSSLTELSALSGVGPAVLGKLHAAGIEALQDLWFHLPLRYEDRTQLLPLRALQPGAAAQAEAEILAVERGFRFRPQLKVLVGDAQGEQLWLRFFHFHAGQVAQLQPGRRLRFFGEPRLGAQGLEIIHPSYRLLSGELPLSPTLDPIYPSLAGVGPALLARLVGQALEQLPAELEQERLPLAARALGSDWSLAAALRYLHRPPPDARLDLLAGGRHPAQRRLQFDELLAHQLSLRRQRARLQAHGARPLPGDGELRTALLRALPFRLTEAQQRVGAEIAADLQQQRPMLRLVQGDVGCGKTVVAALAALQAIEVGAQVALLAPTELLAEQHCQAFRGWFEPLGIEVAWLAGKVQGRTRERTVAQVQSGQAMLVVGTHALFQAGVGFARLGLVIVDEQHRFGVHQRLALRDKGAEGGQLPHQLVMTATPIPRTLAMTAYADLDVSRIDGMPPGRTPVRTVVLSGSRRAEVAERIRHACAGGAQVYWVCPLIEESEELRAQAAESTYRELSSQLAGLRLGLLHGRLKAAEKYQTMARFKAGELDLLVATTVIEVGVDVPNASLMVIENAERLGLSQLHQLRGRVGRGAAESSCVLLYQSPLSAMAKARLSIMRESNDGFVIAERDLELRGPGELLGTRQTGLAQFRIADLGRDGDLLEAVAACAERLLRDDGGRAERWIRRWIGGALRYAGV